MNTNPEYIEREPDGAVAELMAWLPESTPDNALIELEAHTLRGVLAVLDQWEQNARTAAAQRNAAEGRLEAAKVDMRLLREDAGDADKRVDAAGALKRAAYADRSAAIERADEAERELAELRERIGEARQEWGVQHPLLGTEYVQGSENARYLCRTRNEEHPGYEWRVVKRLTGEWKVADDA